ncbi:VCBS repeat-containing protein [Sphingopyxis sp.]|jgi:hypothetical protein|uniref:FG-GAP repeat domain-containing protein n=1 Tax=Sphingopyxis sp. TaxID=1908224 RepID=UPI002DF59F89|nr:VCBS repeat-containing protein [Sphingopyxis sp.]
MRRTALIGGAALAAAIALSPAAASARSTDAPKAQTGVLKPQTIAEAEVRGTARWTVRNGVISGDGVKGDGWLLFDFPLQDIEAKGQFRCSGPCRLGALLRIERTGAGGWSGILVPVGEPGRPAERIIVDRSGRIAERKPLPTGGAMSRLAVQPPAGAPSIPKARAPATSTAPFPPPPTDLRTADWNDLGIVFDANVVRVIVNGATVGSWVADADGYGAAALFIERGSRADIRGLSIGDTSARVREPDIVAGGFTKQQLNDFFYGWSAAAGDIDRDGKTDIVAGPFIYFGGDFQQFREFDLPEAANPATDYPKFFEQYVADFTGDGWPDILAVRHAPPFGQLYVNPKGEKRRWAVATVLDMLVTEKTALADIDGDGKAELLYTIPGELRAARPDPANPAGKWLVETLSKEGVGPGGNHGFGTGDLNGDGRLDIVSRFGWWENPGAAATPWRHHAQFFGRHGPGGAGGAGMAVYDVNGDGLNDVVTALSAHGYGLAWFEQTRDAAGKIGFTQHLIMDGPGGTNAGGFVFSQAHGSIAADVNGDGIPDFVTGKRYFSHLESWGDPDSWGPPVLYWYETVRDPSAPGGAQFVPHLIHNRSGVGSELLAADLDGDGHSDLVTSTRFGTAIFWNRDAARR